MIKLLQNLKIKFGGGSTGGGGSGVTSVNGDTGPAVVLDADDISDASTTNKFTDAADISKLAGIQSGATVNQTDAFLLARANHTGTQLMATISNAGNSATLNVGTGAGTVCAGNDSRLADAREWAASTVSQADAEAGSSTTRTAWTAQRVRQAILAVTGAIGTTVGRAIFALTNPSTISFLRINADNSVEARSDSEMRTDLSLGTIATQNASAVAITGGTIAVTSGSASTPGLSIAGDSDTGVFSSATNTIDLTAGGVTKISAGILDVTLTGGDRVATTLNDPAGTINLVAGDVDVSSSVNGIGGAINLTAGAGFRVSGTTSFVRGGSVSITGGAVLSARGKGGGVNILGGTGIDSFGGDVQLLSGFHVPGVSAPGHTGIMSISTAFGTAITDGSTSLYGTSSGGVSLFTGGGSNTNTSGSIAAGSSGPLYIYSGNGGNATAGTANGGNAGNVEIRAGRGGTSAGGTPGADGTIIFRSLTDALATLTRAVFDLNVPLELPAYTVATLPAATTNRMIIVSDDTGGLVPAFSDGTNWRRVTDRNIVS